MTLARTGVTSAGTFSAEVLPDVVTVVAVVLVEELEFVDEAEPELDADDAVVGAAEELSLDVD